MHLQDSLRQRVAAIRHHLDQLERELTDNSGPAPDTSGAAALELDPWKKANEEARQIEKSLLPEQEQEGKNPSVQCTLEEWIKALVSPRVGETIKAKLLEECDSVEDLGRFLLDPARQKKIKRFGEVARAGLIAQYKEDWGDLPEKVSVGDEPASEAPSAPAPTPEAEPSAPDPDPDQEDPAVSLPQQLTALAIRLDSDVLDQLRMTGVTPWNRGLEHYQAGGSLTDCPYATDPHRTSWLKGWLYGRASEEPEGSEEEPAAGPDDDLGF